MSSAKITVRNSSRTCMLLCSKERNVLVALFLGPFVGVIYFSIPRCNFFLLPWSLLRYPRLSCFKLVDFFYLECGAEDQNTDNYSIIWSPDNAFVSTGTIGSNLKVLWSEMQTLRYFSGESRAKNCFTIPENPRQVYSMRAWFYHGSCDNSMTLPSFQLVLDSTIFENV